MRHPLHLTMPLLLKFLGCAVLLGACASDGGKRARPDPIEVLDDSHDGLMRPDPEVRRSLDGIWCGSSGRRDVVVDLLDGLGYCDVEGAPEYVIMLTSVLPNGHVEAVVQAESGTTFYWFARVVEPQRLIVDRIARWQDDPLKLWPDVPFELRRS